MHLEYLVIFSAIFDRENIMMIDRKFRKKERKIEKKEIESYACEVV